MITFDLIVKTYYKQKMLNLFLPSHFFLRVNPIPSNQFTQPSLNIHAHLSSIPLTILLFRENKVQDVNRNWSKDIVFNVLLIAMCIIFIWLIL